MEVLALLEDSPILLFFVALFFGAIIGSFLNVVIHRLPIMMYKEWLLQCDEIQKDPLIKELPENDVSLILPRSFCTNCGNTIRAIDNIPIFSYIWLLAKCRSCGTHISPRYFLVELACGLLCVFLLLEFGIGIKTLFLLTFTFLLVPLAFIDLQHKILPDNITYLLLWIGVIYSLSGHGIDLRTSIYGVIVGYLSLWSVYILFKLATGKEGMGHGDFKLLAAIGAWVGWQQLLTVILISSISGTILTLTLMLTGKKLAMIPFGPFLAIGGWIALIWGDQMAAAYLAII